MCVWGVVVDEKGDRVLSYGVAVVLRGVVVLCVGAGTGVMCYREGCTGVVCHRRG